jgi:hypothetical protein
VNDAAPRRVQPPGAPRMRPAALPPVAARCEDGLLLLFIAFVRGLLGPHTAPYPRLLERGIAYESYEHIGDPGRVELRGLEPLTLSMPLRCAPSCATAPSSCAKDDSLSEPYLSGAEGIRTPDLISAIDARSQLRYSPMQPKTVYSKGCRLSNRWNSEVSEPQVRQTSEFWPASRCA